MHIEDVAMQLSYSLKELREMVAPFARPTNTRGLIEVAVTMTCFLSVTILGILLVPHSIAGALLLSLPAGLFLLRLFVLQHDAGHRSLCRSQWLNLWIGRVLATMSLTPFSFWRRIHHMHHKDTGRLDVPAHDGALWVTTVTKYRAMSPLKRFFYRMYHMPIFMFFIGPIAYFLLYYRMWFFGQNDEDKKSMIATNVALLVFGSGLTYLIGIQAMLCFIFPTVAVAASLGVWLFFVQHTFEHAYFAHDDAWDKREAIVGGCSYYKLPRILEWWTGSIGYHSIHHLNPSIPSYRLRDCWQKVANAFAATPTFTIRDSIANIGFTLWDEDKRRMVRFT